MPATGVLIAQRWRTWGRSLEAEHFLAFDFGASRSLRLSGFDLEVVGRIRLQVLNFHSVGQAADPQRASASWVRLLRSVP